MKTVMVTGVGAIIGYGILRSFRKTSLGVRLIGADIYDDAIGQIWADEFVIAPLTGSAEYLGWLGETVRKHRVDLVIPGIEQDVHYFSDHRDFLKQLPVCVALNDPRLVALSRDKWLMHQELLRLGSPLRIPSRLDGTFADLAGEFGLPFILKPRRGYASKGLVTINDERAFLAHFSGLGADLMAQPFVGSDDQEYTVALFGDGTGEAGPCMILKRRLASDGSTKKASVERESRLQEITELLGRTFRPIGPTNFQFRRDGSGWKLLEVNPRISSSTSIRAAFGFNESKMTFEFYLEGMITQPAINRGAAMRYIEDWIQYDRTDF